MATRNRSNETSNPGVGHVGEGIQNVLNGPLIALSTVPHRVAMNKEPDTKGITRAVYEDLHNQLWSTPPFLEQFSLEIAELSVAGDAQAKLVRAHQIVTQWKMYMRQAVSICQNDGARVPQIANAIPVELQAAMDELDDIGQYLASAYSLAAATRERPRQPSTSRLSPEQLKRERVARALLMVQADPDASNAEIAKEIGVDVSTVGRWPELKRLRQNLADDRGVKDGHLNRDKEEGSSVDGETEDDAPDLGDS